MLWSYLHFLVVKTKMLIWKIWRKFPRKQQRGHLQRCWEARALVSARLPWGKAAPCSAAPQGEGKSSVGFTGSVQLPRPVKQCSRHISQVPACSFRFRPHLGELATCPGPNRLSEDPCLPILRTSPIHDDSWAVGAPWPGPWGFLSTDDFSDQGQHGNVSFL